MKNEIKAQKHKHGRELREEEGLEGEEGLKKSLEGLTRKEGGSAELNSWVPKE